MPGMFDGLMPNQEENNAIAVLKDLQDPKNIEMKTDLNIQQIKVLVQFKLYYLLRDPNKSSQEAVDQALDYYMKLLASVGRKSRIEITDAIKNLKTDLLQDSLALNQMFAKK